MVEKKPVYVYRVRLGEGVTTVGGIMQWAKRSVLFYKKSDAQKFADSKTTKIYYSQSGKTVVSKPKVRKIPYRLIAGSHIN